MKDYTDEEMHGWRETFMGQSQDWDEFNSSNKIHRSIDDLKMLLEETDRLLDVGCFVGHLYGNLRHPYYTGIDIDPLAIAKARKNYPGVEFHVSDFMELEGKWDVVWCSRVLHHIPNTEKSIRKLVSLARRKCILVIPVSDDERLHKVGAYWHAVSSELLRSIGQHELRQRGKYCTVIYKGSG